MKIYISGEIAGDPNYKGKFARAAAQLERLGATVINPATARTGWNPPARNWNAHGATMSACQQQTGTIFG